jgi:Icc-related predicted phosphoesterase
MRIVCVSDTHELHREVDIPSGDLLIHAGDILFQQNKRPKAALRDFNEWLGALPHRFKILTFGNHDLLLEDPSNRHLITNATILVNSSAELKGIRIWGSPVTPLNDGAFGISKTEDRKKHWAQIPDGSDILVTHGPAFGILDTTAVPGEHEGDHELLEAIARVKPSLHVCGHSHYGYGEQRKSDTLHINAALFDEFGDIERPPIVIHDFKPNRIR